MQFKNFDIVNDCIRKALHVSFYKLICHNSHNLSNFKSAAKLSTYKTRINLLLLC